MSFFAWILLGLLAGFIASRIVNRKGSGLGLDILLGIVGSVVGGWIFSLFGSGGVSGVNFHSLILSVIGAVVVLLAYHTVRREV